MTERLIEFLCAVLLLAIGNLFFGSILNLKIRRTAFTVLLCALDTLLLLPFLVWGYILLLYPVFVLCAFFSFVAGVFFSNDMRSVVYWAVWPILILGPADMLFVNLLQPIIFHIWGNERSVPIYLIEAVFLIILNVSYCMIILRFLKKGVKAQIKAYANWQIALQHSLVLIINAVVLFSLASLCTALAIRTQNQGAALLVLAWVLFGIVGVVNLLTFRILAKISERNELAANQKQKEVEAQLGQEYAAVANHNAERLERWQHDANNVIATLRLSVSDKQSADALDDFAIKIGVPAVAKYADNILLNQTLMINAEKARARDVRLAVQIALPKQVPLSDIEIIRIFSNLLDNAIRAAAEMPEPAQRVVEVVCKENAGYLYISTRNHFLEGSVLHGTGRGTEILRKFEKSHHAQFTSKPQGDEWIAQLAVKL